MTFPSSKKELEQLGWDYVDVILVSGDAFIDHPSFGVAIIARVLEGCGLRVAILPQPNWRDDLRDFKKLGIPRLFFGVSAGSMDSMVNHYTATKRLRSNDAYTPGGLAGQRPDYAATVYSTILKDLFPTVPVILGGVEASLRRFSHYDYWSNSVKPSILIDSKADVVVYGMGERAMTEIATILKNGGSIHDVYALPQIAYISKKAPKKALLLPSHEDCVQSKKSYARAFVLMETETNNPHTRTMAQAHENSFVVANPPYPQPTTEELDAVYALPYTRLPHSRYAKKPPIPAFEMIQNSVTIHRGCFGACSFCSIAAHQGKFIASRSAESIVQELQLLAQMPYFKGHVSDLGGPSANMYAMSGKNKDLCAQCTRSSCLFPHKCKNLNDSHKALLDLYKKALAVPGIQRITIGSGVRLDLLQGSPEEQQYTEQLLRHHVSGRLKVAPEHSQEHVLTLMRKPPFASFETFKTKFDTYNKQFGLKQQLIPYFISAHPGCTAADMQHLQKHLHSLRLQPEQVQDFTPTPMTLATTMYYTKMNPYTGKSLYVAQNKNDKDHQKSFFFH
ncbi:MAG: YgiQ family radical SAM protein [Bacteroidales bacterium]|jgi:uncharacterized radical SAM protein YgiQ|nr:YgiQ family radical SAM protein [Bacteroidales bacterium]